MRVLGIDPGTIALGYGVIEGPQGTRLVDCGVLRMSSRTPVEARLVALFDGISRLIEAHQPEEMAVEEPFAGINVRSAFMIGRAQAIAILAAARYHVPVSYYSPAEVKRHVSGYGRGDKQQVRTMVMLELGQKEEGVGTDATDALAIALCHLHRSEAGRRLNGKYL